MIPTIDLRSPDAATLIGGACAAVGFFQVVGHGVPAAVIDTAWREAGQFFELPLAQRMQAARRHDGDAYGYLPMEFESLNRSLEGGNGEGEGGSGAADLKETFNVGPFRPPGRPLVDDGETWAFAPTPLPPSLPALAPAFEAYFEAMLDLATRLMRHFAVALDLPEHHFDACIGESPSALRALNYPDLASRAAVDGQLRAGAHTDYGTLTILLQDDAPGGLQVLDPTTGAWTPVPHTPDAFVVNLGDLMARRTNDRWRSTLHRVVLPPPDSQGSTQRRSMAFFHNADYHAMIECLPTCVAPGEPPLYEPVVAGPHLMSKFHRATST
ncbi:MAG: 2OG-Fe(II) oxygenase family protein [Ilumatobacteraceae bacterium]